MKSRYASWWVAVVRNDCCQGRGLGDAEHRSGVNFRPTVLRPGNRATTPVGPVSDSSGTSPAPDWSSPPALWTEAGTLTVTPNFSMKALHTYSLCTPGSNGQGGWETGPWFPPASVSTPLMQLPHQELPVTDVIVPFCRRQFFRVVCTWIQFFVDYVDGVTGQPPRPLLRCPPPPRRAT
jgi:hypothetical protein